MPQLTVAQNLLLGRPREADRAGRDIVEPGARRRPADGVPPEPAHAALGAEPCAAPCPDDRQGLRVRPEGRRAGRADHQHARAQRRARAGADPGARARTRRGHPLRLAQAGRGHDRLRLGPRAARRQGRLPQPRSGAPTRTRSCAGWSAASCCRFSREHPVPSGQSGGVLGHRRDPPGRRRPDLPARQAGRGAGHRRPAWARAEPSSCRAVIRADRGCTGDGRGTRARAHISRPGDSRQAGIAFIPEDRKGQGLVLGLPAYANVALTAHGELSGGPARSPAGASSCPSRVTPPARCGYGRTTSN